MTENRIYFVDVTNRDGVQTSRLGLAKLQKTIINLMLDDMGITQSEFGFPTTKHEHYTRKFRIDVRLYRSYNNTRTLYFDRHQSIQCCIVS